MTSAAWNMQLPSLRPHPALSVCLSVFPLEWRCVTMNLRDSSTDGPQHQSALDIFPRAWMAFSIFRHGNFSTLAKRKNVFPLPLSPFFFPTYSSQIFLMLLNEYVQRKQVSGNVPSAFDSSPLKEEGSLSRSVFAYRRQMENSSVWFTHERSAAVIKHFSAGCRLSFAGETTQTKSPGVEEHLVFIKGEQQHQKNMKSQFGLLTEPLLLQEKEKKESTGS